MRKGKVSSIILAAGQGKRMKEKYNKQYILLSNKPILAHTLELFQRSSLVDDIILVVPKEEVSYCEKEIVEKYNIQKVSMVVSGGEERQDSVYNGLNNIDKNTEIVIIHDGARPFVTEELINKLTNEVETSSAVIAAVPVKDTIKVANEKLEIIETPNREKLWAVQTPQVFKYNLIKKAYDEGVDSSIKVTDDAMMVEALGHRVKIITGSYDNIKITTPEDIHIAEKILEKRGELK